MQTTSNGKVTRSMVCWMPIAEVEARFTKPTFPNFKFSTNPNFAKLRRARR
jgi:hypothetical protein